MAHPGDGNHLPEEEPKSKAAEALGELADAVLSGKDSAPAEQKFAYTLARNQVEENKWYLTEGEAYRTYVFPNGEYAIENPQKVLIKRKPEGDSHRVISRDEDGTPHSHYIPSGWIAIRWRGVDKTEVFGW